MLENLPPCLTRRDDGEIVLTGRRINLYTMVRLYKQEGSVGAWPTILIFHGEIEPVVSFYHDPGSRLISSAKTIGRFSTVSMRSGRRATWAAVTSRSKNYAGDGWKRVRTFAFG